MTTHPRLIAGPLSVVLLAAAAALGLPAQAASTTVVISEVYGGGGNTGAPVKNDYIELYNRGTVAVDLSGWSVQYRPASSTSTFVGATTLAGSIAPGSSYLVQEAAGAGAAAALPTPDATGTIAMSATAGRVTLVQGDVQIDGVAYGSSAPVEGEGAPAPAASNTTSVSRTAPCADTDSNSTDFAAGALTPSNSAAGPQPCNAPAAAPPPVEPGDPETIHQIQGASHRSPLEGQLVDGVRGVVTAKSGNGFWMQDPTADEDAATSEGLFVFTRSNPAVAVGDAVSVGGSVAEFRPGGATTDNLTTTEIINPKITVLSPGNALPGPVVLGVDRVAPPQTIDSGDPGSVESPSAQFRPATDAIDFYESLEGMRVGVRDAQVVGPTNRFGEITVAPASLAAADAIRSPRGGVVYGGYDQPNAMRVQLDDALIALNSMPGADVADTLPGDTTGVLDYSFANYKLLVTAPPTISDGNLQREITTPQANNQLAVATFNVENLDALDPQDKFDRLARQVVTNLACPDILTLEEIQDNDGPANTPVVASDQTVARLVAAITAAGGPAYDSRTVDPQDDADGGQPGGNIRQVLLFRTDRDLTFVDRPGGDATTATDVVEVDGRPAITHSPGRVDPQNSAWEDSRKPVVGQFRFRGQDVFVVANHFASKGGDDPLFGRWQPPVRSSEAQRHAQAQVVRSFVDDLLAVDETAKVVVLGDINDFEFSTTTDILVGSGPTAMLALPRTLPAGERYSYVYQGNSQVLDQILISQGLADAPPGAKYPAYEYDSVHTNSEFADQDSDHDPQLARLTLRGGRG